MILGLRAAGRIVAGARVFGLNDPGVDEDRDVIFGFAGSRDLIHIGRIVPGHEDLVGAVALAEDLLPGTGSTETALLPGFERLGQQAIPVRLEPGRQFRRDLARESGIGGGAVVARPSVQADLVLQLHHHDGLLEAVHFGQVAHQRSIGPGVGCGRLSAQRAQNRQFVAVFGQCEGILLIVRLDPDGMVGTHAVLPAAEPEQSQLEFVLPGRLDQFIHNREVELAFDRLHLLPGHHGQDGIHSGLFEIGPQGLHIRRAGSGGIAQFAANRQERLPLHDQLGHIAALLEVRCGREGIRRCIRRVFGSAGGQQQGRAAKEGKQSVHRFRVMFGKDTDFPAIKKERRPKRAPFLLHPRFHTAGCCVRSLRPD